MGVAHAESFFVQVGPKNGNVRKRNRENRPMFRTTESKHKLLMLVKSPHIFSWKSGKGGVVLGAKFGPN